MTSTTSPFRILIIEDDLHIARLLLANLNKAGFVCRAEASGRQGLFAFENMTPHLVLLDLGLPDISGYEVCDRLRNTSTVPIIMLTARQESQDELHGLKMGADDYITKPFDPKLVMARIVTQLRRAYRYDAPPEEKPSAASSPASTPANWMTCDVCAYMGPREKFKDFDPQGTPVTLCPHCNERVHSL